MRAPVCITMLVVSACASGPIGTHHETLPPTASPTPDGASSTRGANEALAIVRVINGTPQAFRVQIAYGGSVRTLGSVSGLETRDFTIARSVIVGYEEFQLLVALRDGSGDARESERFSLSGVHVVEWNVDARRLRSVTLR